MTQSRVLQNRSRSDGFTLVELAIVLAIIGVLVGGVIAGQYMIRRTQLQAIVNDFGKYKTALAQFKEQYQAYPGDFADATEYWGTDTTGACPSGVSTPKRETCNGNADGTVTGTEGIRAWQHLANAGVIPGMYSGVRGPNGALNMVGGLNAPAGKIGNSTFQYERYHYATSTSMMFPSTPIVSILYYGLPNTVYLGLPVSPLLTPEEMQNMDRKFDDGLPALGGWRSLRSYHPNCTNDGVGVLPADVVYKLSYSNIACSVVYVLE